jgi:O-antigen/teichoic acid export membrane protein
MYTSAKPMTEVSVQENQVRTLSIASVSHGRRVQFVRHAVVHVIANLGTLACSGVLAFLLPRFLSVDDYGYYRLFLLYGSFAGILHFGFLDGLLIRWAARPRSRLKKELSSSLAFLGLQHLVILSLVLAASFCPSPSYARLALAFAVYAILWNWATLGSYAIQALKLFEHVSFFTILAPLMLLLIVLILHAVGAVTVRNVILACLLSNLIAAAGLWTFVRRRVPDSSFTARSLWASGRAHTRLGWSVLGANLLATVALSLDRLVLSRGFSIRDFAIYSFAANTLALTYNMVLSVARVLFPYLSDGVSAQARIDAYSVGEIVVVLLWAAGLATYFPLAGLISRWVPSYAASLPLIRILMLAAGFTAGIHILHGTYFRLVRRQDRFLVGAAAGCASALLLLAVVAHTGRLSFFAWAMVGSAVTWWIVNEYMLRETLGYSARKILKTLALTVLCACIFFACVAVHNPTLGCAAYLIWVLALVCVMGKPMLGRAQISVLNLLYSTPDEYGHLN